MFSCCEQNSVDPDQTPQNADSSDLGLNLFKKDTLFAKEHDASVGHQMIFLKKINSIQYLHLK